MSIKFTESTKDTRKEARINELQEYIKIYQSEIKRWKQELAELKGEE